MPLNGTTHPEMEQAVRWNVKVSRDTDVTLRAFPGSQGMKKGDLSKFIEQAVRSPVFHRTIQDLKLRNGDTGDRCTARGRSANRGCWRRSHPGLPADASFASGQSGIAPRGYSFTNVRRIVETFAPVLAAAPDAKTAKQIFDQMMRYVQQARLPRPKRKRPSYPRQVRKRGATFLNRKRDPGAVA